MINIYINKVNSSFIIIYNETYIFHLFPDFFQNINAAVANRTDLRMLLDSIKAMNVGKART